MMQSRRQFLQRLSLLSGLGAVSASPLRATIESGRVWYASALKTADNAYAVSVFDLSGEIQWTMPLPERAHGTAFHPNLPLVAVFGRRPGFYADIYQLHDGKQLQRITPEKDHHFYGHGLFSPDGKHLITQENHMSTGEGRIVIRDWNNGQIVNQFPSYGIGPHESCILTNQILVVANGGLKTHPDQGRKILNLDTMAPNLSFISLRDGELLHQVSLPDELHQLSIRHIDTNTKGQVAVGMQYQGPIWKTVPLVALADMTQTNFRFLSMPEPVRHRYEQYCGSVTFDKTGSILAISSPKGGLTGFWDVEKETFLGSSSLKDVCGVATTDVAGEFLLSTGLGKRTRYSPLTGDYNTLPFTPDYQWDNHMVMLG